eukprot:9642908-Lingulodinium_polyedra.AAC.1
MGSHTRVRQEPVPSLCSQRVACGPSKQVYKHQQQVGRQDRKPDLSKSSKRSQQASKQASRQARHDCRQQA